MTCADCKLADMVGRRKAIMVGCVVFIIGGSIQTAAQGLSWMWGGRFLGENMTNLPHLVVKLTVHHPAGMGIGMLAMLAPLYQSEIAHPSIRGRLTTLQQFMLGIGAFIASFIGYGCFHGSDGGSKAWAWRVPLAIQIIRKFAL